MRRTGFGAWKDAHHRYLRAVFVLQTRRYWRVERDQGKGREGGGGGRSAARVWVLLFFPVGSPFHFCSSTSSQAGITGSDRVVQWCCALG
jgi:hypothetical protein